MSGRLDIKGELPSPAVVVVPVASAVIRPVRRIVVVVVVVVETRIPVGAVVKVEVPAAVRAVAIELVHWNLRICHDRNEFTF